MIPEPAFSFKIVIPAYKAEEELKQFLPTLLNVVPADKILIVIDGLTDNTKELCDTLGVPFLLHRENRGKGAALTSAFLHIKKDVEWIITMDADGQHSPHDLPYLFDAITQAKSSCGIVYGQRKLTPSSMPIERVFSNRTTSALLSFFAGEKVKDSQCGYRAYSTEVTTSVICHFRHFEMESEILIKAAKHNFTFDSFPIQTIYPEEGTSHISHLKDTLRWIRAVLQTFFLTKRTSKR